MLNHEKKHQCEIILISKDVSPDGSVDVHCHFENYDKTLLPGMYMNADVEVSNNLSNALPNDCIVSYEGNNYVFIAIDTLRYAMKTVAVGNSHSGITQIINAHILQNKTIVAKGAYTLLMQMKNTEE